MLSMITVPDDTVAIAYFRFNGENLEVNYANAEGSMPPPRRQTARVLRLLADHLEREADELGGES